MQLITDTNVSSLEHVRKPSPLGLLIAVVREAPKRSESQHKTAFRRLVRGDGYEDFVEAVIDEWLSIKYSTAWRAANPPTKEEVKSAAIGHRRAHERSEKRVATAKRTLVTRLLDFTMPNGKPLRDNTGRDCAKAGGFFAAIAKRVKPNERVGDVLTESDLAGLMKS